MEKPNVRFHDGQILSEEPLNKAMEAVDYAVEEANKVQNAVNAASSAAKSASATASSAAAIKATLDEIKGSGDIPAATVAQVAENTADISQLALKLSYKIKPCIVGTINNDDGSDFASSTRVRSAYFNAENIIPVFPSEIFGNLFLYNSNKTFVSPRITLESNKQYTIGEGMFARVTFGYSSGATLSVSDAERLINVHALNNDSISEIVLSTVSNDIETKILKSNVYSTTENANFRDIIIEGGNIGENGILSSYSGRNVFFIKLTSYNVNITGTTVLAYQWYSGIPDVVGGSNSLGRTSTNISPEGATWCGITCSNSGSVINVIQNKSNANLVGSNYIASYEQGTLSNADSSDYPVNERVRTDYVSAEEIKAVSFAYDSSIISGRLHFYDQNKNKLKDNIIISRGIQYDISDCSFVRWTFLYSDGTTPLSANIANDIIKTTAFSPYASLLDIDNVKEKITGCSFLNNSIGEQMFALGMKQDLKILGFGNSFMRNSVHFLSQIANGCGVNVTVGNLYTGGTNLRDHVNCLLNPNISPYEWHKYVNGVNTVNETNKTSTRGLLDEHWDAIIVHQYTPWSQPFEPLLNEFISLIIKTLGYCPKFYINSTWGGHKDYVKEQYGFNTEEDMRLYMLNAVNGACKDSGIVDIIPTGTAIQNARTLSWADSYKRFVNSGTDWHHLNAAGGFIAACTIYEKIIYPLNKKHCSATTFRVNSPIAMPPQSTVEAGVIVNDSNYLDMCNAAIKAVENMDNVTTL